jgi:PilZ domain
VVNPTAMSLPFEAITFGERITITAYRGGDKFHFGGHILRISGTGIAASMVGTLTIGELVSLHSANPVEPLERQARVTQHQGETYEFEFLSLTDRQLQCLTKTCDWLLAGLS